MLHETVKHDVLQRMYAGWEVASVGKFFSSFLPNSLLRPGDSDAFHALVERTVVVVPPGAKPMPHVANLTQVESHTSLVDGLVGELLRSSSLRDNVLCKGLQLGN